MKIIRASHRVKLNMANINLIIEVRTESEQEVNTEHVQKAISTAIELYGVNRLCELVTRGKELNEAAQGLLAQKGLSAVVVIHQLTTG